MRSLLLATLIATTMTGAYAQNKVAEPNWVQVGATDDATYSIDKNSLKRDGDMVTVWESIYMPKKKITAKIFREYDCKEKRQKILSETIYNKDGENFSRPIKEVQWQYVVRESVGEQLMIHVCKNAPKGLMDYFK